MLSPVAPVLQPVSPSFLFHLVSLMTEFDRNSVLVKVRGKPFISLGGKGQTADGIMVRLIVWLPNGDWESDSGNPWLQADYVCIWLWDL